MIGWRENKSKLKSKKFSKNRSKNRQFEIKFISNSFNIRNFLCLTVGFSSICTYCRLRMLFFSFCPGWFRRLLSRIQAWASRQRSDRDSFHRIREFKGLRLTKTTVFLHFFFFIRFLKRRTHVVLSNCFFGYPYRIQKLKLCVLPITGFPS